MTYQHDWQAVALGVSSGASQKCDCMDAYVLKCRSVCAAAQLRRQCVRCWRLAGSSVSSHMDLPLCPWAVYGRQSLRLGRVQACPGLPWPCRFAWAPRPSDHQQRMYGLRVALWKSEVGSGKWQVAGEKWEVGSRKWQVGSRKLEVGCWK